MTGGTSPSIPRHQQRQPPKRRLVLRLKRPAAGPVAVENLIEPVLAAAGNDDAAADLDVVLFKQ